MAATGDTADGPVSVNVDIKDGRTTITVTGDDDAAVVVESSSGERVYLPPEKTDDPGDDGPYRPAENDDTPYDGIPDDSPYDAARETSAPVGLTKTANGFRIIHPEVVTDFRILR